jgi:hypothetical protein
MTNTAEPGARTVRIAPERLVGWLDRFAGAHGSYELSTRDGRLVVTASDGTRAAFELPAAAPGGIAVGSVPQLLEIAAAPTVVGLVIVRKGGFAVGVAHGTEIVAHRTGSRYVQGRTAAGGSSQARFMRRR